MHREPGTALKSSLCSNIRAGLEKLAYSPRKVTEIYENYLDSITTQLSQTASSEPDPGTTSETVLDPEEYPAHVNKRLYDMIYTVLQCTCSQPWSCLPERHWGGLRLKANCEVVSEEVVFEAIVSTRSLEEFDNEVEWKHLCLRIPR